MNIRYEKVKKLENEITNRIVFYIMNNREEINFEKGKKLFMKIYNSEEVLYKEEGFLMWLIWDYKVDNLETIIEQYRKMEYKNLQENERAMLDSLINGYFSVYKITKTKNTMVLKDIFLKKEFLVEDTININNVANSDLLIGRVYEFENKNYIYDEYNIVDKSFGSMLERNIYEKFEEYKEKVSCNKVQDFIQENSIVIIKMGIIINQLLKEQKEDSINLWQSIYIYIEQKDILDKLYGNNYFEKDYEENEIVYLKLISHEKERVIAEIVIHKNKMEIECNSEADLNNSKLIIEKLVGEYVKHLKDEILSIDDLI